MTNDFLDRMIAEACTISQRAGEYFGRTPVSEEPAHEPIERLSRTLCEMRFTSEMAAALAWLMARKAKSNDETISEDLLMLDMSILRQAGVSPSTIEAWEPKFPDEFREILLEGHRFVERIRRLA